MILYTVITILTALFAWWSVLYYLDRKGLLKRWGSLYLFIFLLKTGRGRKLIDRIASKRGFWKGFGYASIVLSYLSMILMFFMLLLSAYLSLSAKVKPTSPSRMLVLPGINPIIPFWYGIIALIIAVVIHEFSHGIQARVDRVKIKSLGVVMALIPIGAFVEPDEEEVKSLPRVARMRMFAAGPGMNITVAVILGMVFCWGLLGSVHAERGAILYGISEHSPINLLYPDTDSVALLKIGDSDVSPDVDFYSFSPLPPGTFTDLKVLLSDGSTETLKGIPVGVVVVGISKGYPAEKAGIIPGTVLIRLNGKEISSEKSFSDLMAKTHPGDVINLTVLEPVRGDEGVNYTLKEIEGVKLEDKYKVYPYDEFKGVGFLGVSTSYLGVYAEGAQSYINRVSHPIREASSLQELRVNLFTVMFTLPMNVKLMPFRPPITTLYTIRGPFNALSPSTFWVLTNTIYYIFWINILLGTFNTLPLLIMDGGVLFKDTVEGISEKFIRGEGSDERRRKWSEGIYSVVSYLTAGLLLIIIFAPYFVR